MVYLEKKLIGDIGVPIVQPVGGHGVFINAKKFLADNKTNQFPGISIINELYLQGGIRSVEIGSAMMGKNINGQETSSSYGASKACQSKTRIYSKSFRLFTRNNRRSLEK